MEYYRQSKNSEHLRNVAERISYEALGEVAVKYGRSEVGQDTPTVADLAYHNLWHSLRVRSIAGELAVQYGLSDYDIQLTRMIAASHDVVHESTDTASPEQQSIDWIIAKMQQEGFDAEDKQIARLAIDGTTPLFDDEGYYAEQKFASMGFPNERAELIALCVAAADMGAAHTHYGPIVAHELFKEYAGIDGLVQPTTLDGLEKFQNEQIAFLQNLQPLRPELDQILGGLKSQGIVHHEMLLKELQSGRISTWAEVERYDTEYAEQWNNVNVNS